MAGETVVGAPVTETPEFKAAVAEATKTAREEIEKTIRASNEEHLAGERRRLEALYGPPTSRQPSAQPPAGKDFFQDWGEKHQLPAEAGLELAQGVIDYIER